MIESAAAQSKFSRRDIVRGTLAGAGTLALWQFTEPVTQARKFCKLAENSNEVKETADPVAAMKQLIRDELNVVVVETEEAYTLSGRDVQVSKEQILGMRPRMWTEPTLTLLYNSLQALPEQFLETNLGEEVHVALDYLTDSSCACAGEYFPDLPLPEMMQPFFHSHDVILLDPGYFVPSPDPDAQLFSLRVLGHEMIHRYDIDVTNRKSWEKMMAVFGGNEFSRTAATIRGRIEKVGPDSLQPAEALAANRLAYGFHAEHHNFSEAVASMGEVYLFGENYFNHGMSLYLGRDTAEKVYDILRDDIFCGKEYDRFPSIC